MNALREKKDCLDSLLRGYGELAVAVSGGVDSMFLAAAAAAVLPGKVLLLNARSPAFPPEEGAVVEDFARARDLPLVIVPTEELKLADYASNPADRCYHCRGEMYSRMRRVCEEQGYSRLADGSNLDDLREVRPGGRAAAQWQVLHPLQEAGFGKQDVRSCARALKLRVWDKPAFSCLASRFPYGEAITEEKLKRVEKAERLLREAGFSLFRVRSHGDTARLEFGEDEIEAAFRRRAELSSALKELGFVFTTIDLDGFRSGSMNEALGTRPT